MSLAQSLTAKNIDKTDAIKLAKIVAERIRSVVKLESIYLFGSAADGTFHDHSDLDFLIVFANEEVLRAGRKAIHLIPRIAEGWAVDYVFVTKEQFNQKRLIGGVCFIAFHDGIEL